MTPIERVAEVLVKPSDKFRCNTSNPVSALTIAQEVLDAATKDLEQLAIAIANTPAWPSSEPGAPDDRNCVPTFAAYKIAEAVRIYLVNEN